MALYVAKGEKMSFWKKNKNILHWELVYKRLGQGVYLNDVFNLVSMIVVVYYIGAKELCFRLLRRECLYKYQQNRQ